MRYQLDRQTAAATLDHPQVKVRLDYATRARTEEHSRRRREAVWSVLSFVVLLLCWDLSGRLDRRVPGIEPSATAADVDAAEPMRKPSSPRRLRKLSEEADSEAFRSLEWIR